MSGLSPQGPSQPTLNQAYTTPGNPVSHNPDETSAAASHAHDNSAPIDRRVPEQQATSSEGLSNAKAPAGGIHGAPPGEEAKGLTEEDVGRHNELDGAQMAAPGEGRVAAAVAKGGKGMGGGGAEPDLAGDLDRKKAEQADAREAVKQSKGEGNANAALGQSAAPADAVGTGGYPNSGVQG